MYDGAGAWADAGVRLCCGSAVFHLSDSPRVRSGRVTESSIYSDTLTRAQGHFYCVNEHSGSPTGKFTENIRPDVFLPSAVSFTAERRTATCFRRDPVRTSDTRSSQKSHARLPRLAAQRFSWQWTDLVNVIIHSSVQTRPLLTATFYLGEAGIFVSLSFENLTKTFVREVTSWHFSVSVKSYVAVMRGFMIHV